MNVDGQLVAPGEDEYLRGQNVLNQFVLSGASAAAPVAWTPLYGVQQVTVGDSTYANEYQIMQQGALQSTNKKTGPTWPVTLNVLKGDTADVLAQLRGQTFGSSGYVSMPFMVSNDNVNVIITSVYREADNVTVHVSRLIQDFILDDMGDDTPMDYADGVISGHTYYPPAWVKTGYEPVLDVFAGTPSTASYPLSAVPATAQDASIEDLYHFDNAVFIKLKDNSAGDAEGQRRVSGVSITGTSCVFTAGTPAASDVVSVLYYKATP